MMIECAEAAAGTGEPGFPMELTRAQLEMLLPHRGDILFVKSLRVIERRRFTGTARWTRDQAGLAGHFPGLPIVPAVFIVEAAAQVAGAGLLATQGLSETSAQIGVLAAIRKCNFRHPVFPEQVVRFEMTAQRSMAGFVSVSGEAFVGTKNIAALELVIAQAPRAQFEQFM